MKCVRRTYDVFYYLGRWVLVMLGYIWGRWWWDSPLVSPSQLMLSLAFVVQEGHTFKIKTELLCPSFSSFKGESFRETLLTVLTLEHFLVASPDVLLESDDIRHKMLPFSLFRSSFSGAQRILGYVRPRRIAAAPPPKRGKRRQNLWAAFGGAFKLGQTWHSVVT